jgi:hypothetical protein
MRPDDPEAVMQHAGRYNGGKALIVLGGYSGSDWEALRQDIRPNVLLGANGVVNKIDRLDYFMLSENMSLTYKQAKLGDARAIQKIKMFDNASPMVRLMSHRSWDLIKDKSNCICIRRDKNHGSGLGEVPDYFSFRDYGEGFLNGWLMRHKTAGASVHVGTVGVQLLHMAGILGCSEVHTIGYDLVFESDLSHHWYEYPKYEVDRFRTPEMFINYHGVRTQWVWVETMEFLREIQPLFIRDGLKWYDHSHGLLELEGIAQ